MDPVAHTLTGAALAGAGLRRITPLATATLLLAANAPDVDAVLMFAGDYMDLAHRRGLTHGLPAMVVLTFALTGLMLLWDRYVRRRRWPDALPARAGPLLLVAAIGMISHPLLDWLNNYGMRWLMPFENRWSYGDALFIIDPWVWLVLGGLCFLMWSQSRGALLAWGSFWIATSWLVLTSPFAPQLTRALWIAGLVALAALRWRQSIPPSPRAAQWVLAVTVAYMSLNILANLPARAEIRQVLESEGLGPVGAVMIGPAPGNPFRGNVVAEADDRYYLGDWNWLARPRFAFDGATIPSNMDDPQVVAAGETVPTNRFLIWSRFPYAVFGEDERGPFVRFGDARYPQDRGPARGPRVYLEDL